MGLKRVLRWTASLGVLMGLAAPAVLAGPMIPIAGDPVRTSGGAVAGTRLASGVRAYFGVPYAQPPTQGLRWRPPQPIRWDGVWNADRKGPECIQVLRPHNINHYFGEEATSEDCLYLNVWTPPGATAGSGRPVIVFIYGGGGTIGSSGMANYDGEALARKGAVFVNFNYRVGLLGFLAHPELTREGGGRSGNYGYLDQTAALRWIRDNIRAFGGDPTKVVIMGQSFGAGSVAAQVFSPQGRGLFRGAVMSSACNYTTDPIPLAAGEQIGANLQQALGAADLEAMRQVPADRILAVQSESQLGLKVSGVRTAAVIDGAFFTGTKRETLAAHAGSDVPIIAGWNEEDIDLGMSPFGAVKTLAEFRGAAQKLYGPQIDAFLRLFPAANDAEARAAARQAAHEIGFERSSRTCAQLQAQYNRSRAYLNEFAHRHPYVPGVVIADQDTRTVGAYHTADVPYWLGTLDKYNLFRPTRNPAAWDRTLSDTMMDSLIAFANTGDPRTPRLIWPAWSPRNETTVVFGDQISVRPLNTARLDWIAAHTAAPTFAAPPPRGVRD